jgi:hypothetical protein
MVISAYGTMSKAGPEKQQAFAGKQKINSVSLLE